MVNLSIPAKFQCDTCPFFIESDQFWFGPDPRGLCILFDTQIRQHQATKQPFFVPCNKCAVVRANLSPDCERYIGDPHFEPTPS